MKQLLGIAALVFSLSFSVQADLIEVVIAGTITEYDNANTSDPSMAIDLSDYNGDMVQYSFIIDADRHGTYFDGSNTVDYGTWFESFHVDLSDQLHITEESARGTATITDLHYGYVAGGETHIGVGETVNNNRNHWLEVKVQQGYDFWTSALNDNKADTPVWEVTEWLDNGYIRSHNFSIVSTGAPASVPEPSAVSLLLSGMGVLGFGMFVFRRKK